MILVLLGILSFIAFAVVFIVALVTGRKKLFPYAIGLFVTTAILGGISVSRLMGAAMNLVSNVEPRTGEEMYAQSMRFGALDCVKVINSQDRKDFFRDCCTWLEFETCPDEVSRVLDIRKHSAVKLDIGKVQQLIPAKAGRPDWWRPGTLGDSVLVVNFEIPMAGMSQVPGFEQKLFLSADSTKGFYYERMDTVFKKDTTDN